MPYVLLRGLRDIRRRNDDETQDANANAVETAFEHLDRDIEVTDAQARTLTKLASFDEKTRTSDYEALLEAGVNDVLIDVTGDALLHDGSRVFHYTPNSGWKLAGPRTKSNPTFAHLLASLHKEALTEFPHE